MWEERCNVSCIDILGKERLKSSWVDLPAPKNTRIRRNIRTQTVVRNLCKGSTRSPNHDLYTYHITHGVSSDAI